MTTVIRSVGAMACALIMCALGASAHADSLPTVNPRIVNGVLTDDFPAVGALLRGSDAESASAWCSGTLIGCSTFLTAGHCIEGRTPGEFFVYLPNAGVFPVASIALHPSYNYPAADVGVLKLATPVTGVGPTAIETDSAPPFGTPGVLVGYGRSGDPLFDYGLKRSGDVVTASCTTIPAPGSNTTSVCWDFTAPIGPPGSNSNTCNADSGGPLLVDLGPGRRVAGTTSGGSSASCNPTDHSYDANVFTYRSFIQAQGGADLANTSCGGGPQVGDPGTTVVALDGSLSNANPDGTHTFSVPNGTTKLRVAMNAVDDGASDFDLYVKEGSAPTTTTYDCGRFGPNQYGVCEFTPPTSGTWYVLVHRFAGSGPYQVTVTEFATACAAPGSDGTSCDDGNACTSSDVCQSGSCVGTPVTDGMPCSDGNACTGPDTCQSGVCNTSPLPNGTPCDDGDPCTRPDTCEAGTCTGTGPVLTCKTAPAGQALFTIDNRSPDTRDRLAWTFHKGPATTLAELGTPTTTTPYALCLYDDVSGTPERRLTKVIPPGAHWKGSIRGFRFFDTTLSTGGIQSITLTTGSAGRSSLMVRGRGQSLGLPGLPLAKQPNVIVQFLNDTTCWSSTYSTAITNGIARFKGKNAN
jgi:hypothetical protein